MARTLGCESRLRGFCGAVGLAATASLAQADPAPDYSASLFGDLGGFRQSFAKVGGALNLTESEVFANSSGGLQRGADYDGLTTLTIQLDSKLAFGWAGGQFNASVLQLHGENFSARDIAALQIISGVEGDRATRLWELWWDQKFGDHFDVKVGQQSLDVEFINHPSAGYFVNSLFGWPTPFAADMPGGGPDFPLSALGVRARATAGPWTALAGIFSGAPASNANPDPQRANPYGVGFPVQGALVIAEAQFAHGQGAGELAGVYKIGGWHDSLGFADLRYNALGQRRANPTAVGPPLLHGGDFGLYALAEQMVWRGGEKERTLSLFLRPTLAPQGDRNLVTFGLDGGLALRDPLPGRKDDTFALGFGLVEIGSGAVGSRADLAFYNPGVFTPRRDYEAVLEATYQCQATPWAQIQPDLQYIRNPGGGLADPLRPNRKVGDAVTAGLRINLTF